MDYTVTDFDYYLPSDRIAQSPKNPRELAKLMIVNRAKGLIKHYHVGDLPNFFLKDDVVVINNTKVFHARLHGTLRGSRVELFLIRPVENSLWLALGKPGKKFHPGDVILIAKDFSATICDKNDDGTMIISFSLTPEETISQANKYGEIPVPPYIKKIPKENEYQTIYAKYEGSVAAPTAGFHMTKNILTQLKQRGVTILEITLHVGLGTFMPIKSETLNTHIMHSEWVEVLPKIANTINNAKKEKKRIIAIGTTTVRTLEGVAALHNGTLQPFRGDINLFIKPGYKFQIVNGMLTNFHLPKSTLIVLVSAFAGREIIMKAYEEAVKHNYRFYSFGDAMFIS